MLTTEEQESVMHMVRHIISDVVRHRKAVDRNEMDHRRYQEHNRQAMDRLRDLLKELG